jgi:hypothetical protein
MDGPIKFSSLGYLKFLIEKTAGGKGWLYYTGLLKKKYTLSKIYFTKTTDAKSMSCVRMERKSLKVLISMI